MRKSLPELLKVFIFFAVDTTTVQMQFCAALFIVVTHGTKNATLVSIP